MFIRENPCTYSGLVFQGKNWSVTIEGVRCLLFMCPAGANRQIGMRGTKTLTHHAHFGMLIEQLKK